MNQLLIPLGIILVFAGIVIIIIGSLLGSQGQGKTGYAVGGFIGPIPFGFANSKEMLYVVVIISVIMLVFILFSILRFVR